ncbi:hypothetical protein FEMY_24780 [Ferrovum myxofaciens]|uniref:ABC-type transport auxiliary lipoprotein component domain-containing protein n=1 Tax=Ferrovum myxofaciens TaxID=416213 RepID=A0A149VUV8_9PROT|nr:hypothetical protein [Ferrovum myxofaciens]KXW56999.1 hypothetical protein FEMY_24780 [Ferrovum myxofaciens]
MKPYKNLILLGVSAAFLASCATPPPNLSNTPSDSITVPAKKVVIADLMREQKYNPSDTVLSGGFHPLPSNATVPSFPEFMLNNLRARLRGNDELIDNLEISVLDSNILMESRVADSVPFINIASVFFDRKYMCVVDINIRYKDKTVRKKFDATYTKSREWSDIPTDEKNEMVSACSNQIVENIAKFSLSVIQN